MGLLCAALSGLVQADSAFVLSSPAFGNHKAIPVKFTCDGSGNSPPLFWSSPPAGTQSLALIVTDPDAPGGVWVHWVLYDLSPGLRGLKSHIVHSPHGSKAGRNSWGRLGYGAPCPPSGHHHYVFRLYAVDKTLSFAHPPFRKVLLSVIHGHILAIATLVGVYGRSK
ncbi:YbhB/YbcL family Raf kinase inhibitor-like protein [Acidihalobacter prosperus]